MQLSVTPLSVTPLPGNLIAASNTRTGQIFIDTDAYHSLTPAQLKFAMLHERWHLQNPRKLTSSQAHELTSSQAEEKADLFAARQMKLNSREAAKIMYELGKYATDRTQRIRSLKTNIENTMDTNANYYDYIFPGSASFPVGDPDNEFLFDKLRARLAAKKAKKAELKQSEGKGWRKTWKKEKAGVIEEVRNTFATEKEAKKEKRTGRVNAFLDKTLGKVGEILGGGTAPEEEPERGAYDAEGNDMLGDGAGGTPPPPPEEPNYGLYAGIGIGSIVLIIGVVFLIKQLSK